MPVQFRHPPVQNRINFGVIATRNSAEYGSRDRAGYVLYLLHSQKPAQILARVFGRTGAPVQYRL